MYANENTQKHTTEQKQKRAREIKYGKRSRYHKNSVSWSHEKTGVWCGALFSDRFLGDAVDAHDVARAEHSRLADATGFYADCWCDNVVVPVVVKTRARFCVDRGKHKITTAYIPAVRFTDQDGVTSWPGDYMEAQMDAARLAYAYAEKVAEEARDYEARDRAQQEIEERHEHIKNTSQDIKSARAELQALKRARVCDGIDTSTLRKMLRAQIVTMRSSIKASLKRIQALEDNYWCSVEHLY
jgi:hypothetical protein